MDKFILPNFHAILIHFPLGMLGIGVLIELFSFMWRRRSFRVAGQWLILFGTLATIPAVTSGLYAMVDVMGHGSGADSWIELKQNSGLSQTDWNFLRLHLILNACASGIALFAVFIYLAGSDAWRRFMRVPSLLLLLVAMGLMADGAWHGGEMVYRLGFAVQGKLNVIPDHPAKPQDWRDKLEYYAPEGEVHLLAAGLVFSLAVVSLGLSIRRAVTTDTVVVQRVPPTYVSAEQQRQGNIKPISLLQALNDPEDEIPVVPPIPSARFWLLTALVAIAAIGSGLWFGDFLREWPFIVNKARVLRAIHNIPSPNRAREGLHIVFGASILVLSLVLALLTRFAPRSRVILSGFSLLMVAVMAGQIWLGVMLTFDGGYGPKTHFKTATDLQTPEPEEEPAPPPPATQPSIPLPPTTLPIT